ncbi:MAG: hypothetical protein MPJ50_15905 [Pirellulales bacterium]|nr:hypothetical protein [Pirellulales bacterium]
MDHPPMLEDEIILCTAVLVAGLIVGCILRLFVSKTDDKSNHPTDGTL